MAELLLSASSLQEAYDGSTGGATPEILTDATRGPLTVKDGSGSGLDVIDLQNAAGATLLSSKATQNTLGIQTLPSVDGTSAAGIDLGTDALKFKHVKSRRGQFVHIATGTVEWGEDSYNRQGGLIAGATDGPGTSRLKLDGAGTPAGAAIGFANAYYGSGEAFVDSTGGGAIAMGMAYSYYGKSQLLASGEGAVAAGFTRGYHYGNSVIIAGGGGSFAQGGIRAYNGNCSILSTSWGTFAQGAIRGLSTGAHVISSTGAGAFAQGYAFGIGTGAITAAGKGSFVQGYSKNGGGLNAAFLGGFAQGSSDGTGTLIKSGGTGAFAQGMARNAYRIYAGGNGSFAHGDTGNVGNIDATATNAAQFGPGVNALANSLQVGALAGGIRLCAGGYPGAGPVKGGDMWVVGANVYIHSQGGAVLI